MQAKWNGKTIAQSKETIVVEGNHYFPVESLNKEYLQENDTLTNCAWKGTASYYDVVVDGAKNDNAAWYYPDPTESAKPIKGYVAFWRGVDIEKEQGVKHEQ